MDDNTKLRIEYINKAAMKINEVDDPMHPSVQELISKWSSFQGKDGQEVSMGNRMLGGISEGWVKSIYYKAQKAYKAKFPKAELEQMDLPLDGKPQKEKSPPPLPKVGGSDDPDNDLPF